MTIATEIETYQDQHEAFQRQNASVPPWLSELRQKGLETFTRLGIPNRRIEDWRFTNVAGLADRHYNWMPPVDSVDDQIKTLLQRATLDDEAYRLVFINGRFCNEWSAISELPSGVVVENLAGSIRRWPNDLRGMLCDSFEIEASPFAALNTAFLHDGANIAIADSVHLNRPVHLVFLSIGEGQGVSHPRILIRLGKDSKAQVIESFTGDGDAYFTNAITQIEVDANAELDHHKLQHEQLGALHLATTHVTQQTSSQFRSHYFSFGASLARNEVNCTLNGEQIETMLNGLYMPTGNQLMDCRTRIDHVKPNCNSSELYKGILDDEARGVFSGKIYVHQDAQKTDAKQSNQALLLSDDAVVNTKPQLEIYADDVRCTHGATIGELDEKALYYLRSRGIPLELARKMLIFAFANDLVLAVKVPAVRRHLESILLASHGLPDV
ncbi:MAG: Fe-S cluster assembly protein SufD [Pirellulaceae bacterium]|nr:Fe-S cluster assembly protein SufD [Pirellulaceae bacterium]